MKIMPSAQVKCGKDVAQAALVWIALVLCLGVGAEMVGPIRLFRPHLLRPPIPSRAPSAAVDFVRFHVQVFIYCAVILLPAGLYCIHFRRRWLVLQGVFVAALVCWHFVPDLNYDWETQATFERRMSRVKVGWTKERVIQHLGDPDLPTETTGSGSEILTYWWFGVREQGPSSSGGPHCEYTITVSPDGRVTDIQRSESYALNYF